MTLDAVVRAAGDAAAATAGRLRRHAQPAHRRARISLAIADARGPGAHAWSHFATARRSASATWPRSWTAIPPPIGDAVINDGPGLLLIVEKQPWGNTLEVTREVEAALEALRPGLAGVEIDPTIFRPATFIEVSLDNLTHALC